MSSIFPLAWDNPNVRSRSEMHNQLSSGCIDDLPPDSDIAANWRKTTVFQYSTRHFSLAKILIQQGKDSWPYWGRHELPAGSRAPEVNKVSCSDAQSVDLVSAFRADSARSLRIADRRSNVI